MEADLVSSLLRYTCKKIFMFYFFGELFSLSDSNSGAPFFRFEFVGGTHRTQRTKDGLRLFFEETESQCQTDLTWQKKLYFWHLLLTDALPTLDRCFTQIYRRVRGVLIFLRAVNEFYDSESRSASSDLRSSKI